MSKKVITGFEFSPFFHKQLEVSRNIKFSNSEFKRELIGGFFQVEFHVWECTCPSIKMETTITKSTLQELERALIAFFQ